MKLLKVKELISDVSKGPLDLYRKRASFDWKLMKINLEGEEAIEQQARLYSILKSTPVFARQTGPTTLDEKRRRCNLQIKALAKNQIFPLEYGSTFHVLFYYDPAIPIKMGVVYGMVPNSIYALGKEHHYPIVEEIFNGDYNCCFALTEIAHGTNAKGMRTTATYDVKSKSFVLHSADFEAAKCWVGGLGKTCTHALTFAQLVTPDGVNRGLHPFIVPIRDTKTFLPIPGVTVGDMGEKIGLNSLDNGFVMFHKYHIPRTSLLNKNADVTEDGKYVSAIKDPSKRFGSSLIALSGGRVTITSICSTYLSIGTAIAVRYCAVRKQFGPSESEEWPVLEYQVQQWRLFPHLAAAFAMKIFSEKFLRQTREFTLRLIQEGERNPDLGMEVHALSSAAKPLCAWTARDGIQDCRESCGGHGYLLMGRLGDLRADNDANCTYEGENNVLIQQTSNWLLNQWSKVLQGIEVVSPLETIDFINNAKNTFNQKFTHSTIEETLKPENLVYPLKWLICYYLRSTYDRVQELKRNGATDFEARNDSQAYYARTLTLVYAEHAIIKYFIDCLNDPIWKQEERDVLYKLCSLYAAVILERRLTDLYAGGYADPNSNLSTYLRDGIIMLCKDLVNEAVSLADVLAPPDFIMNCPLGMSDGNVYKHIEEWIFKDKQNLERPSWWREVVTSKL